MPQNIHQACQIAGVDIGSTTVKTVLLTASNLANSPVLGPQITLAAERCQVHHKQPRQALAESLGFIDLGRVSAIAVTGRLGRVMLAGQVPTKAALRMGVRATHPDLRDVTVLSIGANGFRVLEVRESGEEWFAQNSRCAQGTGNFLDQLAARFGLTVQEASAICEHEDAPAPLSGRCPVILKTDMTHLANKGESQSRILAGLYDAVCESALSLIRPRFSPRDVILIGGVGLSARVRRTIAEWLDKRGMRLCNAGPWDRQLEAIGAGIHAFESIAHADSTKRKTRTVDDLIAPPPSSTLTQLPPLRTSLSRVKRMPRVAHAKPDSTVVLGLDIGSTGSKMVAINPGTKETCWQAYLSTDGAPVIAAQRLVAIWLDEHGSSSSVSGIGVTGSGREVVGSTLRTCFGASDVFVLNEIAAHARGAVELDSQVDTIFEIGGQDAKYIRLDSGKVVDAAMNEACSAGTGSFIAEQGTRLGSTELSPAKLGLIALNADSGVSLGQHCSVFMAEVIDEATAQGAGQAEIVAGLFDSVIKNYLNRVKGSRTIGRRIFCQGMPFSSDALAAAVARQTGRDVVVPPDPGTIGAYGIALLAADEFAARQTGQHLDLALFLCARVTSKETLICQSTKGCGGTGNHCRVDRLTTQVRGVQQRFVWGGNCSLYDRGLGRRKLPDLAPDPFSQRQELISAIAHKSTFPGERTVAIIDNFATKSIVPLLATFIRQLGLDCRVLSRADGATLRKGIETCRVPYCAPLELLHGAVVEALDGKPDTLIIPLIKDLPRLGCEPHGELCPLVLAAPDIITGLNLSHDVRICRPTIEFGTKGYRGQILADSLVQLARELGREMHARKALECAIQAQEKFENDCVQIGRDAIEYCKQHNVVQVAVLGRPYTIHNDVLNSNVPNILRSLGVVAIPVDCLPVPRAIPAFQSQYWAHTQRNLRAAQHIRETPGLYPVFCSNYACGPDSFTLHFFAHIMQGKPFSVIETDGHSGDAGTKTRLEAFLYCVDSDLKSRTRPAVVEPTFATLDAVRQSMPEARRERRTLLLPRMGPQADVVASALRSEGYDAEALPLTTKEDLAEGRRHTSGKECLPLTLTVGAILNRLNRETDKEREFAIFMPTANGPCRFGVYNSFYKIILDRTGWNKRTSVVSPDDADYFRDMPASFTARVWAGLCVHDLLESMLLEVRPIEIKPGHSNEVHSRYVAELVDILGKPYPKSAIRAARQIWGRLWGLEDLLSRAASEFASGRSSTKVAPAVSLVGEIYVRLDPFANDFIVDKLESRGLSVRLAPLVEWIEYTSVLAEKRVEQHRMLPTDRALSIRASGVLRRTIQNKLYAACAPKFGWSERLSIEHVLDESKAYLHPDIPGEGALTLGGPIREFRGGHIEGVVIVGPHECMPCKVAESQFGKASESIRIPYLAVPLNGEPIDEEALDRFSFDLQQNFESRMKNAAKWSQGSQHGARIVQPVQGPTVPGTHDDDGVQA